MWIQKVPGGGVTALAYSTDGGTLYTCDGGSWVTAANYDTFKAELDLKLIVPSGDRGHNRTV